MLSNKCLISTLFILISMVSNFYAMEYPVSTTGNIRDNEPNFAYNVPPCVYLYNIHYPSSRVVWHRYVHSSYFEQQKQIIEVQNEKIKSLQEELDKEKSEVRKKNKNLAGLTKDILMIIKNNQLLPGEGSEEIGNLKEETEQAIFERKFNEQKKIEEQKKNAQNKKNIKSSSNIFYLNCLIAGLATATLAAAWTYMHYWQQAPANIN